MAHGATAAGSEIDRGGYRDAGILLARRHAEMLSNEGHKGLYEIRSNISSGRIARVFFVLVGNQMVLLHGFVKKTQKTPDKELKLATARMKEVQRYE
jgi:phage-related protein